MTSLIIFGGLAGMLLGLFFRVLILVPATVAALMRKSLRTQIVLNEILQPPVALREPREI